MLYVYLEWITLSLTQILKMCDVFASEETTIYFYFFFFFYIFVFFLFDFLRRGEKTWRITETNLRSVSTQVVSLSSSWAKTRPKRKWTAVRAYCCRQWRANGKNHVDGGRCHNIDSNRIISNQNTSRNNSSIHQLMTERTKDPRLWRPMR